MLSRDVQHKAPTEGFCYKATASEPPERSDRAMICVPIPNLQGGPERFVGVLSVSSLTPGELTDRDLAIVDFFATLFGRYRGPLGGATAGKDRR